MKKLLAVFGVGFAVLLVIGVLFFFRVISLRNTLVVMEEDVRTQWSQVENQYQRRFDLIPNLIASVRGYMEQEREIFTEIADARTRYGNAATGSTDKVEAANGLESALSRLLVIMENYPELKSDETVMSLMTQLEGTENRISVERRRYNDVVNEFNKTIRVFPNNVINDWFLHFEEKNRFESVSGAEIAPVVDLSFDDGDETTDTNVDFDSSQTSDGTDDEIDPAE